jgi:hypothetical protein
MGERAGVCRGVWGSGLIGEPDQTIPCGGLSLFRTHMIDKTGPTAASGQREMIPGILGNPYGLF